jgi:hypothetical protein
MLVSSLHAQILTVPNGGTGTGTLAAHGPLIGNGTGPVTVGARGTAGQCFISGGLSADPSFQACPAGGGGMVYPAAGISNSTGSAWGTSYGSGNQIPANFISLLNQNTTGNAATATALATAPTKCPAGQYTLGIDVSGNAQGCTLAGGSMVYPAGTGIPQVTGGTAWGATYNAGSQIPANFIPTLNQNTTGNAATATTATTATALAGTPTLCPAGQYALGIVASGNATGCTVAGGSMVYPGAGIANSTGAAWGTSYSSGNTIPASFIPTLNQSTTGNAATATALAAAPTLCSSGQYAQGVLASGNATGCNTPAASVLNPVANITGTYNVTAADFQTCAMKYSASGAVIVNLVVNTSQPPNGQCMVFLNYSTGGTITINRNGQNLNGGTLAVIIAAAVNSAQPNSATVWSDGTNYFATKGNSVLSFGAITSGTTVTGLTVGSGGSLVYTGTGTIQASSLGTAGTNGSATINGGIAPTSGFKTQGFSSCTTTAVVNGSCTGTLTWTTAFTDSNYQVVCDMVNSSALGIFLGAKAAGTVAYTVYNAAGGTAAASGVIECIAVHN